MALLPQLEAGDVDAVVDSDPAFVALLDVATYEKDDPDWTYETLSARIVSQMSSARIVAWGAPEDSLRIRITRREPDAPLRARISASTSGLIATRGALCLAGYTSLTMCAQFDDYHFPQREDCAFTVAEGRYRVDVHRLFEHDEGEQFARTEPVEGDPHYLVVLGPATDPAPQHVRIPWALRP